MSKQAFCCFNHSSRLALRLNMIILQYHFSNIIRYSPRSKFYKSARL